MDEPIIGKIIVQSANDPEPMDIGDSVEFDPLDPAHPIAVQADGYMTLADAEQLHADLGKAIELAKSNPTKAS